MTSTNDETDSDRNAPREGERIRILGELRGEVTVYQPIAVKEISRGGVLIEVAAPLHVDSLHDFRLSLGDRSVVIKGRVAHCRISNVGQDLVRFQAGIEFVDPSDRVLSAIAGFIEAIRDTRKAP